MIVITVNKEGGNFGFVLLAVLLVIGSPPGDSSSTAVGPEDVECEHVASRDLQPQIDKCSARGSGSGDGSKETRSVGVVFRVILHHTAIDKMKEKEA